MAGNRKDSVDSASSTAPNARRRVFPGAWKAFKAKFNYQTAVTPATSSLDGLYVEVFDDMETIVVDSKMDGDKDRVEHKPVTNLEKKVYDLNFLLELGKKATKAPHPLRFSSDAIKRTYLSSSHISSKRVQPPHLICPTFEIFTWSRCFKVDLSAIPAPFNFVVALHKTKALLSL